MRWSGASRRRRVLGLLLVLAVVGGLAFLAVGRSSFAWDRTCTLARRQLPGLLGADVGLGRCEVDPTGRTVRIYGLSAGAPGNERPVFSADEVEITVAGVQPLSARLELERVRIIRPRIWLDLSHPSPAAPSGGCPLRLLERVLVDTLEVRGAEVRVALPAGPAGRRGRGGAQLAHPAPRRRVHPPHLAGPGGPRQRPSSAGGGRAGGGGGAGARRTGARGEPRRALHRRRAAVLRGPGERPLPPRARPGRAALPPRADARPGRAAR